MGLGVEFESLVGRMVREARGHHSRFGRHSFGCWIGVWFCLAIVHMLSLRVVLSLRQLSLVSHSKKTEQRLAS